LDGRIFENMVSLLFIIYSPLSLLLPESIFL
jgi:hypothetical protein